MAYDGYRCMGRKPQQIEDYEIIEPVFYWAENRMMYLKAKKAERKAHGFFLLTWALMLGYITYHWL